MSRQVEQQNFGIKFLCQNFEASLLDRIYMTKNWLEFDRKKWLPDLSQARLSLHINLNLSEEGKYVRIPGYVFTMQAQK